MKRTGSPSQMSPAAAALVDAFLSLGVNEKNTATAILKASTRTDEPLDLKAEAEAIRAAGFDLDPDGDLSEADDFPFGLF